MQKKRLTRLKLIDGEPWILYYSEVNTGDRQVDENIYIRPYSYPGNYKNPRDCQVDMVKFDLQHERYWNLSQMRTGKTAGVLWGTDIRMSFMGLQRILIIAPKASLKLTWKKEIFSIMPQVATFYATGNSTAPAKKAFLEGRYQIICINPDKFWRVRSAIQQWKPQRLIVDESSDFNDPTSKRSKNLKVLIQSLPDLQFVPMTGTPLPNRPTDVWSIGRFVNDDFAARYPKFSDFEGATMRNLYKVAPGIFKQAPRENAAEIVAEALTPSIRKLTDEVNDLPDQEDMIFEVNMGDKQRKAFNEMRLHYITQDEESGAVITADMALIRMQKMLQIAQGVAYDNEGADLIVGAGPKIEEAKRLILESSGKALIMTHYKGVQRMLMKHFEKSFEVRLINGDTPEDDMIRYQKEFQLGKVNLLILGPVKVKYSLQFDAAGVTIWWGPIFSNLIHTQASARMRGVETGVFDKTLNAMLSCCSFERQVYETIADRDVMQSEAVDLYRNLLSEAV